MNISIIAFVVLILFSIGLFAKNVKTIIRNINLGKDLDRNDNKSGRFKLMLKVAMGQSKMQARPVVGILHFVVYAGLLPAFRHHRRFCLADKPGIPVGGDGDPACHLDDAGNCGDYSDHWDLGRCQCADFRANTRGVAHRQNRARFH